MSDEEATSPPQEREPAAAGAALPKRMLLSKEDFSQARADSFRNKLGNTMQRKSLFDIGAHVAPHVGLGKSVLFEKSLEGLFGDQLKQNVEFPSALFELFDFLCSETSGWKETVEKKRSTSRRKRRPPPGISGLRTTTGSLLTPKQSRKSPTSSSAELPQAEEAEVVLFCKGPMIKARALVACNQEVVSRLLDDVARLAEWDSMVDSVEEVDRVHPDYAVLHMSLRKNRDAVVGRVHKVLSDGSHCYISKSVRHDKAPAPLKKTTRMELAPSGFLVKPVGLLRCEVYYLNQDVPEPLRAAQLSLLSNVVRAAETAKFVATRKASAATGDVPQITLEQLVGPGFESDRNVLVYLFDRVLTLGCHEQGIFRISILHDEKVRMEKALMANDREALDACHDAHVFAVLLKSLFTQIPPLLPYEMMVDERQPAVKVWAALPPLVQQTLAALFTFIESLSAPEISSVTLMDEANLLLVFAPSLLRRTMSYSLRKTTPSDAVHEIAIEREAVQELYDYFVSKLNRKK